MSELEPGSPEASHIRAVPVAVGSLAVALGVGVDLALDARAGGAGWHLALEALVTLLAGGGGLAALRQVRRRERAGRTALDAARALADRARDDARRSQDEARAWRARTEALQRGLGDAIFEQLAAWGLTGAEQDVALLLIKGLSTKEIAALRGTGDTTVRQQAREVYRKAGLAGRAELAAFFLEDLLSPRPPDPG